ncbi:hypothetical protein SIID45300_01735 [Candidatus Magnetaquicoccaceae bacterium FCR-1]|uniref:Uncharacterized protein n=1 Tax=Candidatus Magnetaquiglobus chichijimensis TaxID=3141448 RepID=A0ABQ0C944_9PROT
MNGPSKMSTLTTCKDITSTISLPESEGGPTHCGSPAGQTTGRSGPALVRANLSPRQAKEQGLLTSGTSGQPGIGSLSSVVLTQSLASRLAADLGRNGSILYSATWKYLVTPAGRRLFRLAVSVPRTSGKGCSGWPMSGWSTPAARDYRHANRMSYQDRGGGRKGEQLNNQAVHASGNHANGSFAETEEAGQLNPEFVRWLMGYPAEWGRCAGMVTPLSPTRGAVHSSDGGVMLERCHSQEGRNFLLFGPAILKRVVTCCQESRHFTNLAGTGSAQVLEVPAEIV